MSDFRSAAPAPIAPEEALTPQQQRALRTGLNSMAMPPTNAEFNRRLLGALFSDRDLRPWYKRLVVRLLQMLPTLLIGFGLTLALARHFSGQPQEARPETPPMNIAVPPPLPPIPADLWPHHVHVPAGAQRHQRIAPSVHHIVTDRLLKGAPQ